MKDVSRIREFNRYYARVLGVFDRKYLGVDFSVTEVRVLGEIGRTEQLTAKVLTEYLGVDKGYMSKLLQGLERQGLIRRISSETDRRERYLELTDLGTEVNRELEEKADQRILRQTEAISLADYESLLVAMRQIEKILQGAMADISPEKEAEK